MGSGQRPLERAPAGSFGKRGAALAAASRHVAVDGE